MSSAFTFDAVVYLINSSGNIVALRDNTSVGGDETLTYTATTLDRFRLIADTSRGFGESTLRVEKP